MQVRVRVRFSVGRDSRRVKVWAAKVDLLSSSAGAGVRGRRRAAASEEADAGAEAEAGVGKAVGSLAILARRALISATEAGNT
jgi:hypothetical protein